MLFGEYLMQKLSEDCIEFLGGDMVVTERSFLKSILMPFVYGATDFTTLNKFIEQRETYVSENKKLNKKKVLKD